MSTSEDPVQHHARHLSSLPTLALAALVRTETMSAAQGYSIRSVASWGGSCAGSWPFCLFVSAQGDVSTVAKSFCQPRRLLIRHVGPCPLCLSFRERQ